MLPNNLKLIAGGIVGVCIMILALMTYYRVEQYERVVVTRFGKVTEVADPGLHFRVPFVHSIHTFRIDMRQYTNMKQPANTYTIDNQEVDVVFTIFYNIAPDRVRFVYENAQNYEAMLANIVWDRLKAEMGQVNASHVAEKRGEIRDKIKGVIQRDAQSIGINVTDFQLTNMEFQKSFREAVSMAATAKAMVETREQEKQQAIRVAERAKIDAEGKANAAREEAKGEADSRIFIATAEAKAIQMRGEAEAKAIKAQAEALQQNQKLVELRKAEKWNGALPVWHGAGPIPFMSIDKPNEAGILADANRNK